jgi:hypothetical protein
VKRLALGALFLLGGCRVMTVECTTDAAMLRGALHGYRLGTVPEVHASGDAYAEVVHAGWATRAEGVSAYAHWVTQWAAAHPDRVRALNPGKPPLPSYGCLLVDTR